MKKGLTIIFTFLILLVNAQTDKEDLLKTYANYMDVISIVEVDSMLDFVYPKLFDIVPREAMQEMMEETFSDTTIIITFSNDSIHTVSDAFVFDSIHYTIIDYSFLMKMRYLSEEDYTESKDGVNVFGYTKDMLETQYGKKNIETDMELHEFSINNEAQMYAIYNPEYAAWRFLENKTELAGLLNMIIPTEVTEHFK